MEKNMDFQIEKGSLNDLEELATLYDVLNDFLESTINYPGWIKGVYPVRDVAEKGIQDDSLFVFRMNGRIVGSIILNHEPELNYDKVDWGVNAGWNEVFIIHTLVIHPHFLKQGIASKLMKFAETYAREQKMKAIRLDVSVNNHAAINLYEKMGYIYIDTVDLGLEYEHLKWFKLYELVL